MEIWIIRDGEKTGPLHDFEVRKKIESGEFSPSAHAWHEGLDGWKPLSEIPIFGREFEKNSGPFSEPSQIEEIPLPQPPRTTPPPLPRGSAYGRRFWARWFDLTLYSAFWWLCMWGARQNIEAALMNMWVMFIQFVPWFILEALLLHYVGNTPGKWLLGLRVVNEDGSRLNLAEATKRSLRVMFTGVGFGWSLLAVFCQTLSYFTAKRLGTTLWDHTGGHRVEVTPIHPGKLAGLITVYFMAFMLHGLVLYPYFIKAFLEQNPQYQEIYEKNPPWHFPRRDQGN